MPFCSCLPVISVVVEDTRANAETLAMDSMRGEVWSLVMRLLANSCRRMVLQRAARGVLACSLLGDDEPVRTTRGPTPLRRSIRATFRILFVLDITCSPSWLHMDFLRTCGQGPLVLNHKVTSTRPKKKRHHELLGNGTKVSPSNSAPRQRRQQTSAWVVSMRNKKAMSGHFTRCHGISQVHFIHGRGRRQSLVVI